ncbi:hypothetical protein SLEP1_g25243 [Rubroshorea leprosula]|uniref:Late embryogenesis abundant protein LEA-2 subgroup domain-containing protein n=1 Tax=Rubroshorea leprosula TaxID=152421 RepID=A0AAV5JSQ9_9ROSI|nr:hypothetical protein SLEP1_g25243 [Rubroshorea leprosula]
MARISARRFLTGGGRPVNKKECCCGCSCVLFFLILFGGAICTSQVFKADNPKCSVDYFYLPALNRTLNSTTNSTLYFNLKLENPNSGIGINYNDVKVNVTVFDAVGNGSQSSHLLGDTTIQRFHQGYRKTAKKPGHVDYNMTVISQGLFPNATAVFRIDLVTAVRFKVMFLRSKRHNIMVGAKVVVDGNGSMVLPKKKKDIALGSMAPKQGCCSLVLLILGNFLALINLVTFL